MRKPGILLILVWSVVLATGAFAQEEANAYIRFVHFAPDLASAEVQIDGEASDPLEFKTIGDWMAVPAGEHEIALNAGTDSEPMEVELNTDTWYTVVVTGEGETTIIEETYGDMLPGSSNVVFLNAMEGENTVNFNRDGVPFVIELGAAGNEEDAFNSWTYIPVDADTYDFTVDVTGEPENILADLPDTDIVDSDSYLIAVVGTPDNPEVIVDSTRLAEIEIARGDLEAPGTIVEAAQSNEILQPFAEAIEQAGLTDLLSGEGPYTIFVPADFALDDMLAEFEGKPEELEAFLRNHIVEGDFKSQDVFNAEEPLTTLGGENLTIEGKNVNNAEVITVNVPAMNGTIHVINQPLTFDVGQ